MEKTLIGNCKDGKYPNQVDIGFTRDDVQKLMDNLNEKGWVNIRLARGRDTDKPYLQLLTKQ